MRPLPICICNAYDLNISIFNALKEIEATIASQMLILITFALQMQGGRKYIFENLCSSLKKSVPLQESRIQRYGKR